MYFARLLVLENWVTKTCYYPIERCSHWNGQSIYLNPVFYALIQEFCFKEGREPDALNFMVDFEDFPLALYAMTVTVVCCLSLFKICMACGGVLTLL